MAVLKNKTQGRYVNVSKEILMNPELSLRDRGMLVTVFSLPDNWDFNIRGFSKILPDGVDCIRSSIRELTEKGYLTGGQERGSRGRFGKNVIEVHQIPVSPCLENPYTGKPHTESSCTENPTQLNNNRLNINRYNYHPSVCQDKDGLMENFPKSEAALSSIEHLAEVHSYEEVCAILTFSHFCRECEECRLSQSGRYERAKQELKYRIGYEVFVMNGDAEAADALLDYMAEIVSVGRSITFGSETYDAGYMGNCFYQLSYEAVQYVIAKFQEVSRETKIRNKKNYLIRMLLTAKSDAETDTKGNVNYDMAHWHERGNV